MCLKSFSITEVKTSLGKPLSRDILVKMKSAFLFVVFVWKD